MLQNCGRNDWTAIFSPQIPLGTWEFNSLYFPLSMSISGLTFEVGILVGSWSFGLTATLFITSVRPFLCFLAWLRKFCMIGLWSGVAWSLFRQRTQKFKRKERNVIEFMKLKSPPEGCSRGSKHLWGCARAEVELLWSFFFSLLK